MANNIILPENHGKKSIYVVFLSVANITKPLFKSYFSSLQINMPMWMHKKPIKDLLM